MIKHLTPLVLLTGLLASCGQMSTAPSAPTTGSAPSGTMVNLRLGAAAPVSAQAFSALGLPKNAPLAHINVTVRDSSGNPVYFVDGVYAPNGANSSNASSTIVLDGAHGFSKFLLLPKGQYSFENAGKYEDGEQDVLLSYGPASENTSILDEKTNSVQLRFHGVIDPQKSRLDFAMQTEKVYTNDEVHLKLYANTAEVNGKSFPLPLNDIIMRNLALSMPENYTLADWNSAEFMGPGSARGVDLIARGTVQNPNLNVSAHFRAYVRQGGSDVATLQSVELPAFEHAIEVSSISADIQPPYEVTMQPISASTAGQIVPLMGTALDYNGVAGIDVYEGSTLIGSTDAQSSPNAVLTDGQGNWSLNWVARPGTHELTVVARDLAGNESEASQTVTVASANGQAPDYLYNPWQGMYVDNVTLAPQQTVWIQVDLTSSYQSNYSYFQAYDYDGITQPIGFSVHASREGAELTYSYTNDNQWGYTREVEGQNAGGVTWVKVTNNGTTPWTFNFAAGGPA